MDWLQVDTKNEPSVSYRDEKNEASAARTYITTPTVSFTSSLFLSTIFEFKKAEVLLVKPGFDE